MRFSTTFSAAVALVATGVQANIYSLGIPSVIQVGVPFDAALQVPIQQPKQYSILWGVFPYTNETTAPYLPKIGTLGNIIGQTDLTQRGSLQGTYYDSVKGLVADSTAIGSGTYVYVSALIVDTLGVLNDAFAESFWVGPIAVGDHTSTTYVNVTTGSSGWKSWSLNSS